MQLPGALVGYQESVFLAQDVNDDDTVTLLSEDTGRTYRVRKEEIELLPMVFQPEVYLTRCLVEAWEERLWTIAAQHVRRLLSWRKFAPGDPQAAQVAAHAFQRLWETPRIIIDEDSSSLD